MHYRLEIDGLRAIAVTSVVLYHFGLPGLGGGFVGVDVFFVISGFLIGGILWTELTRTGHIDLKAFFLRRIRRLAPAFFAMVIATTVVAYWVLLPFEFRDYGKSLIAATAWLSNVQFFREAGYFDVASESKILLHTWSLAVEEQFYIVLPLLLLLLKHASKQLVIGVLVTVWAVSLIASLLMMRHSPTASFFLFPFRAWEMLSGVLLALWGLEKRASWSHGPMYSWLGLILVLSACVFIRPGADFPGWQAMWPVTGSLLLLMNGKDENAVNRALSARIPVFVGLISYSLYLWHWPVFTLSTYWNGRSLGPLESMAWLLVAIVLSIAAWRWIERPARQSVSNGSLISGFALLVGLSLAMGGWAYMSNGAPDRFGPPARTHVDASTSFFFDESRCTVPDDGPFKGIEVCSVGPAGEPEVLFWGDSHLRAMMGGVDRAAQEAQTPALVIWNAGCPPLFGLTKRESATTAAQDAGCLNDNQRLFEGLGAMQPLRSIVLIGRWTYYASGTGVGVDAHNRIQLMAEPGFDASSEDQIDLYEAAWTKTIEKLQSHAERVHVVRQVPEMPRYVSREIARKLAYGQISSDEVSVFLTVDRQELDQRVDLAERPLLRLHQQGDIGWIDTWPLLCKPDCQVVQDGVSMYFDNNHVNIAGADLLRSLWIPVLQEGARR
jgi:peptidoglycan/LPS O-acetylase OafA/YrhL